MHPFFPFSQEANLHSLRSFNWVFLSSLYIHINNEYINKSPNMKNMIDISEYPFISKISFETTHVHQLRNKTDEFVTYYSLINNAVKDDYNDYYELIIDPLLLLSKSECIFPHAYLNLASIWYLNYSKRLPFSIFLAIYNNRHLVDSKCKTLRVMEKHVIKIRGQVFQYSMDPNEVHLFKRKGNQFIKRKRKKCNTKPPISSSQRTCH